MSTEQQIESGAEVSILSKNQNKAIKSLKGTGVKKVDGITRVVIRKRQGPVLVIESPEVYRTPNGSYLVFGETKVQESQDIQKQFQQLTGGADAGAGETDKSPEAIQADLAAAANAPQSAQIEEEIADEDVDVTGLDEENIKIVMDQANVPKYKAVNGLRANSGDLVNTLMQLTS